MMASKVSAIPEVRSFLLGLQRKLAEAHNVVMDGRDIATVVLPDAKVKIFLTASAKVRAKRRYDELIAKGTEVDFDTVTDTACLEKGVCGAIYQIVLPAGKGWVGAGQVNSFVAFFKTQNIAK